MKTLFLHIGTGKTGSSAIQEHLNSLQSSLAERKVCYWGLNLESAPKESMRSWQRPDGIGIIQRMSLDNAKYEIGAALDEALSSLEDEYVAIWSNESIHELPDLYVPVLQEAQLKHGIALVIVAYTRNAASFLQSAYKQWGIMHKTGSGPVPGFTEWVNSNRAILSYGEKLRIWDNSFSDSFKLINYDFIDDIRKDFLARVPRCEGLVISATGARENASPSDAALALYALYNSQFEGEVYPHAIMSLLSANANAPSQIPTISLTKLFPTEEEINVASALFKEDQEVADSILARNGQPLLSESSQKQKKVALYREMDVLAGALASLISVYVEQQNRIKTLEDRILSLQA